MALLSFNGIVAFRLVRKPTGFNGHLSIRDYMFESFVKNSHCIHHFPPFYRYRRELFSILNERTTFRWRFDVKPYVLIEIKHYNTSNLRIFYIPTHSQKYLFKNLNKTSIKAHKNRQKNHAIFKTRRKLY